MKLYFKFRGQTLVIEILTFIQFVEIDGYIHNNFIKFCLINFDYNTVNFKKVNFIENIDF